MADIQDTSPRVRTRARGWHVVLAAGLAVLTAAVTTVVARSGDPASADTFVSVVREAQVYLPDGTDHPAVEGERLVKGASVHTSSQGGAQLTTAGRTVYVGGASTLRVLDGVHQALDKGLVMVDARRGAGLDLATTNGAVQAAGGSLTRVEELPAFLRVAVYAGGSAVTPVGRSASTAVPGLYQVQVNYGALPGAVTPLALRRGDPWDMTLASTLYTNDTALLALADSLAGDYGKKVYSAAPVALRTGSAPSGTTRAQDALALLIAQASGRRSSTASVLEEVRSDYALGGSWGVIAAIVDARVNTVSALLAAAVAPVSEPGQSSAINGGTAPGPFVPGPGPIPSVAPSAQPSTGPTGSPVGRPTPTPPVTSPTVAPAPSPSPSLVTGLVNTLIGVLTPKSSQPGSPNPSASPCLLGLLGC